MPNPAWQPGVSGNPKGRPRKENALADLIRAAIAHKGDDGRPRRLAIIERLVTMAETGDMDAIKVVLDRIDGKVPEKRTIEGGLNINLSWDDGSSD